MRIVTKTRNIHIINYSIYLLHTYEFIFSMILNGIPKFPKQFKLSLSIVEKKIVFFSLKTKYYKRVEEALDENKRTQNKRHAMQQ